MNKELKQYTFLGVAFLVIFGFVLLLGQRDKETEINKKDNSLTAVSSISHGHGLAVDVSDPKKLYIATHEGLFVLMDDKNLYRVGKSKDDFMGFSPHPQDSQVLYTSGHPQRGGNIGVQKSEDGGVTWQRISSGAKGPVDFHAMEISAVNSDLMYGWHGRSMQRSRDGGKNWNIINSGVSNVISMTAHPKEEKTLFVATNRGIQVTKDSGDTWEILSSELENDTITVVDVNPQDADFMLAYSTNQGMIRSIDGGQSWQKVDYTFGGDVVLHVAFQKQNPDNVYTLTKSSSIYKSSDKGSSWIKIY